MWLCCKILSFRKLQVRFHREFLFGDFGQTQSSLSLQIITDVSINTVLLSSSRALPKQQEQWCCHFSCNHSSSLFWIKKFNWKIKKSNLNQEQCGFSDLWFLSKIKIHVCYLTVTILICLINVLRADRLQSLTKLLAR